MRRMRYMLWLAALAVMVLAGCSKEHVADATPVGGTVSVRTLAALAGGETPDAATVGVARAERATGSLTYTFEAWTREAEPRCVLHRTVEGSLTEGVAFDIVLIPAAYDFLFWADSGAGCYDTSDLRQVTVLTEPYRAGNDRDAFACVVEQVEWDGNNVVNAVLTRPLAKLTLQNTVAYSGAEAVAVTYHGLMTCYDVLTGEASVPQEQVSSAWADTQAGSTLVGEDFIFVPADDRQVSLSVEVGERDRLIEELPLQVNYKTNVTAVF